MTTELGSTVARDIYALLYTLCRTAGGTCKCSHAYIMQRISCTEKQCRYNLQRLVEDGYILRKDNSVKGRGSLTEYTCQKGLQIDPPYSEKKGYNNGSLLSKKRITKNAQKGLQIDPPYKYILKNNINSALFNSAQARDLFCDFISLFPSSKLREKKAREMWDTLSADEQQAAYEYAKQHPGKNVCFFLDDRKWQVQREVLTYQEFYARFGTDDPDEVGGWKRLRENETYKYIKL